MIYLAAPYSDPDHTIREDRYRTMRNLVFRLTFSQHIYLFSPIVYAHRAALELDLPTDAESWKSMNTYYQRMASELWVLPLPGWKQSKGVKGEIALAKLIRQPIKYVTPMGKVMGTSE